VGPGMRLQGTQLPLLILNGSRGPLADGYRLEEPSHVGDERTLDGISQPM
jgi:hypothetical protein